MQLEDSADELSARFGLTFSFPFDRMYELRGLIRHLVAYIVDKHGQHLKSIEARSERQYASRKVSRTSCDARRRRWDASMRILRNTARARPWTGR